MQLDEPQSSIRYFLAASIILSILIYLYFSAGPVQDDWRCRRSIYLSNISEIIRIGISFKFIAASRTKMFLFWFICIFLQNDRRCNRSFYLSTNILKIIRKCACAAGSDACQRMVMRICERCRNVPDFYQRDAFLIFAPLLLCSNLFFFDRLSILDLCGESVDSVPAAVCESTATWLCFPWWEARNEVSGDFWAKKVEFFPCEIAASVCGSGEEETAWYSRIFHCD